MITNVNFLVHDGRAHVNGRFAVVPLRDGLDALVLRSSEGLHSSGSLSAVWEGSFEKVSGCDLLEEQSSASPLRVVGVDWQKIAAVTAAEGVGKLVPVAIVAEAREAGEGGGMRGALIVETSDLNAITSTTCIKGEGERGMRIELITGKSYRGLGVLR